MNVFRPKNILLISPEAWGTNMLSKHHYARFLAEDHTVFFLNPATGYSTFPFGNMEITCDRSHGNLILISYKNLLPKLNWWPAFIRRFVFKKQAERILKKTSELPDLIWSFDPRRFNDQRVWKAPKAIYHSVDFHPDSDEKMLVNSSDLVIGLSDMICDQLRHFGKPVLKISHGCHVEPGHLKTVTLPGKHAIKAIYTGNFHRHVDYALFATLAGQNPDCDFILVGPSAPSNISSDTSGAENLTQLKTFENIHLVGEVNGKDLPDYVNSASICLVLFKKEFEKIHHAPHKLMAYFASGKVILANPMAEYKGMSEDLIMMVSQEDIPKKFREIIQNLPEFNSELSARTRKDFSAANHYRIKIRQILGKLGA